MNLNKKMQNKWISFFDILESMEEIKNNEIQRKKEQLEENKKSCNINSLSANIKTSYNTQKNDDYATSSITALESTVEALEVANDEDITQYAYVKALVWGKPEITQHNLFDNVKELEAKQGVDFFKPYVQKIKSNKNTFAEKKFFEYIETQKPLYFETLCDFYAEFEKQQQMQLANHFIYDLMNTQKIRA